MFLHNVPEGSNMKRETTLRLALLSLILLGLLIPAAAAQASLDSAEPTGVITGTLGGAELQWQTLAIDTPGEVQSTATYSILMDRFYNYSLQGHQGSSLIEGAVTIAFSSVTGAFTDCPCELEGEIMYWTTTAMFEDVYLAQDAIITILEVEELAEDVLRLVGTAEGQLNFYPNLMNQEQTDETAEIQLEFSVNQVNLLELDY